MSSFLEMVTSYPLQHNSIQIFCMVYSGSWKKAVDALNSLVSDHPQWLPNQVQHNSQCDQL